MDVAGREADCAQVTGLDKDGLRALVDSIAIRSRAVVVVLARPATARSRSSSAYRGPDEEVPAGQVVKQLARSSAAAAAGGRFRRSWRPGAPTKKSRAEKKKSRRCWRTKLAV
jgi:hypothetical protein